MIYIPQPPCWCHSTCLIPLVIIKCCLLHFCLHFYCCWLSVLLLLPPELSCSFLPMPLWIFYAFYFFLLVSESWVHFPWTFQTFILERTSAMKDPPHTCHYMLTTEARFWHVLHCRCSNTYCCFFICFFFNRISMSLSDYRYCTEIAAIILSLLFFFYWLWFWFGAGATATYSCIIIGADLSKL